MPKSSRSITPKPSSKNHRSSASAPKASSASKAAKPSAHKSEKAEAKISHKNGHKNGHKSDEKSGVAAPSKSIADSHAKDAKGVQAVWTGQPERQERLRDLVKLAKDQGYLTWDDLNEAIPESVNNPEELEAIIMFLRNLEIDVIDASEVDRYKQSAAGTEEELSEEEKTDAKLDILDDPVRMYLKQMGQVPLLTREQEVEISKRIEDAESMVQKHLNRFGFTAREYLNLARKLEQGRERFDRVIQDKKIDSRDKYLATLKALVRSVEAANQKADQAYAKVVKAYGHANPLAKAEKEFAKTDAALQKLFIRFYYKQKVTEEFVIVCEHHHHELVEAERELEKLQKSRSKSREHTGACVGDRAEAAGRGATRPHAARPVPRGPPSSRRVAAQGAQGEDGDGGGESAAGYFDREEVHEPRPFVPGPDPGREHGPDEGGGEIRVSPRLQVFDLRDVVD